MTECKTVPGAVFSSRTFFARGQLGVKRLSINLIVLNQTVWEKFKAIAQACRERGGN